jgi:hypothetical protein
MTNFKPATVFAAITAGVVLSAVSLAADSASLRAAETAAESDYRNAIATCNRMNRDAARHCMRDIDAALRAATMEAQDEQGGGRSLEPGTPDGAMPTYRQLPAGERLPANLACNAVS